MAKKQTKKDPNKVTVGRLKQVTDSLKNESGRKMAAAGWESSNHLKKPQSQVNKTVQNLMNSSNRMDSQVKKYTAIIDKATKKKK